MRFYRLSLYSYGSNSDLIFIHENLFTDEEWRQIANEAIHGVYQDYLKSEANDRKSAFVTERRARLKEQMQAAGTWTESMEANIHKSVDVSLEDLDMGDVIAAIEARGFISMKGRESAVISLDDEVSLNNYQPDEDDMTDTAQLIRFINK